MTEVCSDIQQMDEKQIKLEAVRVASANAWQTMGLNMILIIIAMITIPVANIIGKRYGPHFENVTLGFGPPVNKMKVPVSKFFPDDRRLVIYPIINKSRDECKLNFDPRVRAEMPDGTKQDVVVTFTGNPVTWSRPADEFDQGVGEWVLRRVPARAVAYYVLTEHTCYGPWDHPMQFGPFYFVDKGSDSELLSDLMVDEYTRKWQQNFPGEFPGFAQGF